MSRVSRYGKVLGGKEAPAAAATSQAAPQPTLDLRHMPNVKIKDLLEIAPRVPMPSGCKYELKGIVQYIVSCEVSIEWVSETRLKIVRGNLPEREWPSVLESIVPYREQFKQLLTIYAEKLLCPPPEPSKQVSLL